MEIGSLCVKIAGRDAGMKCVVIEVLEGNFVMVDGETRRKRCNLLHLEPLGKKLKVKAKASHDSVVSAFKEELGIEIKEGKKREKTVRPRKVRKGKAKPAAQPESAAKKPKAVKSEKKPKAAKAEEKKQKA